MTRDVGESNGTFTRVLSGDRLRWLAILLAAVAGAGFVAHALRFWDLTVDDAAISFTFARNLVSGHGLVVHPGGERVEAYSNLTWVLLLGGAHMLGISMELAAKVLGVLFGLVAVALVAFIPSRIRRRPISVIDVVPALATAGSTALAVWCVAGLENGLFAMLLLLIHMQVVREVRSAEARPWSAVLLVLLCLTRPEGPLYFAATAAWRLWQFTRDPHRRYRRRTEATWLLTFLLGFGAFIAWRLWYFGYPLPNAYYIKSLTWPFSAADVLNPSRPGWRYVAGFFRSYGLLPILLLVPVGLLDREHRSAQAMGIGLLVAALAFPIYVQGDWMPEWRFLSHAVPLLFLLAGAGLPAGVEAMRGLVPLAFDRPARGAMLSLGVAVFLFVALWAPGAGEGGPESGAPLARTRTIDTARFTDFHRIEERGLYFEDMAAVAEHPDATLLDPDLGGTSFSSGLEVIDLFGLGDLSLSRHRWRPPLVREYLFGERRPTFIHLHGAWFGAYRLQDYEEMRSQYILLPETSPSGFRAEGKNWIRKDLLAAPWRPVQRERAVTYAGGSIRLLGLGGGPEAVSPGDVYRVDLVFTVPKTVTGDFEPTLLVLPPATPAPGQWQGAPAVLVSTDYRPFGGGVGEVLLAFRCPKDASASTRLQAILEERGGEGRWPVVGGFARPPADWRKGAECLWRGVARAPRGEQDLALTWTSGSGAPWKRTIEGFDTRPGGLPTPAPAAFGLYPSSRWIPGERVVARARVLVPADAAPGRRRVLLGLRRLPRSGKADPTPDFVTAQRGIAFAQIAELEVGRTAEARAYRGLDARVASALATGRLGEARLAYEALLRFDDSRGHTRVRRTAEGLAGALFSRAITVRAAGDLDTASRLILTGLSTAPWLEAAETLRRTVAVELLELGLRAERLGDVDRAFQLLGRALSLERHLPAARRVLEQIRDRKAHFYDPGPVDAAWGAARALTSNPSSAALEETLLALEEAGMHEDAVALCPYLTCGAARSDQGRLVLARAHRALGELSEAAALLDPATLPDPAPAAAILRHDVLALLGRTVPSAETEAAVARLPNPMDVSMGPWTRLVGWEAAPLPSGRTGFTVHLTREREAAPGDRVLTLEASGAAGAVKVRRLVRVSPAPLVAVQVRVRLATGIYRIKVTLEGHGSAVIEQASVDGPNRTFEEGTYRGWRIEGAAFGSRPTTRRFEGQQPVNGWRGNWFVNSFRGGDSATGRLLSSPFVIEKRTLSFLLGGGRKPRKVGVRLLVDGVTLREATGRDAEVLRRVVWDVSALRGQTAALEVFDQDDGAWGHVLFDDVQASDVRVGGVLTP